MEDLGPKLRETDQQATDSNDTPDENSSRKSSTSSGPVLPFGNTACNMKDI